MPIVYYDRERERDVPIPNQLPTTNTYETLSSINIEIQSRGRVIKHLMEE